MKFIANIILYKMSLKSLLFVFLVILSLVVLSSCSTTIVRKHNKFNDYIDFKEDEIAILQVESNINIIDYEFNKTRQVDKEEKAKKFLRDSASHYLQSLGYKVKQVDVTDKLENSKDLRIAFENLSQNLANQSANLYKKKRLNLSNFDKFNLSLNPIFINPFYDATEADLLLFITSSSKLKSDAAIANEIASNFLVNLVTLPINFFYFAGNELEFSSNAAYLLDTKSGDILWSNIHASTLEPFDKNDAYNVIKKIIGKGF